MTTQIDIVYQGRHLMGFSSINATRFNQYPPASTVSEIEIDIKDDDEHYQPNPRSSLSVRSEDNDDATSNFNDSPYALNFARSDLSPSTHHWEIECDILTEPLTTFTCFDKLPTELRLKIWKGASQLPSIVGIKDYEEETTLYPSSAQEHLALMHTCYEARREILKLKKNYNVADPAAPTILFDGEVDILWLQFKRKNFSSRDLQPLYAKLMRGSTDKIRRLAVSYDVFKRRWEFMNAMILKLDLEVLVFVVEAEIISQYDVATMIMPRSNVGNRSKHWRTWELLKASERRNLDNVRDHYMRLYKRRKNIKYESTPEKLSEPTMRDLSHWKIPRVLFREIVNSKNATIDEIQLAEEDEALDEDDLDYEDDTEYEDGDY